jgi:competence protein ComEC
MRYIRVWVALVGLALVRVLVWPGDLLSDDDFAWILRLRQGFYHFVEGVYGEPYASFLGGLTVGLQPAFPLELKMAFRDTGLLHILVVSGSNIALVISCFMISAFFLRRQRRIFFFGPAILSFVFFAGLSAPTLRAGVMGLLMVLSLHVGRARSSWRALVFAGLLLVIVNPSMISSISFWLSFLATMAVLFVYSRMEESLKIASPSKNAPDTLSFLQRFLKNPICAFFLEGFLMTLAVEILTLPVLLLFGQFSLIAPVANMVFLPLLPVLLATGAVGLFIPFVAPFFVFVARWYFVGVKFFASLPFAVVAVVKPSVEFFFCYYGLLIFIAFLFRKS